MMWMGEELKHSMFFKTSSCSADSTVFPGSWSDTHAHALFSKTWGKYKPLQVLISLLLAADYSILHNIYFFSHITRFELKFYILSSLTVSLVGPNQLNVSLLQWETAAREP